MPLKLQTIEQAKCIPLLALISVAWARFLRFLYSLRFKNVQMLLRSLGGLVSCIFQKIADIGNFGWKTTLIERLSRQRNASENCHFLITGTSLLGTKTVHSNRKHSKLLILFSLEPQI